MKRRFWHYFKQILVIIGASLASAVSIELLLLPSNVIIGGATGIASLLDLVFTNLDPTKWYISVGVWMALINVPILAYAFCKFKKSFTLKTILYVALFGVELILLRAFNVSEIFKVVMIAQNEDVDKVLYVVLGGALHGLSLPMLLSVNASTGGSDVVGLIVQRNSKKSSSDAMRVILMVNMSILLIATIVLFILNRDGEAAVNMVVYSVAAMFISEIVQEYIFKGYSAAVELEITTDKPLEMTEALQKELKHGTTSVKVVGGYTHSEKTMILCILNKSQLSNARRIINQVDPNSFAYVENVREVIGNGFANKELELEDNT